MSTIESISGNNVAGQRGIDTPLRILIGLVWCGLLVVHACKALGYYPLVLPDEYYYITDVRFRAYSEVMLPGYIYYAIYSLTGWFDALYLDAGRVFNAVIFMLSAPFLYKTARLVAGVTLSLFVTFLILISPISTYTIYFMPESIYFTSFWALFWLVTSKGPNMPLLRLATISGMGIGVLAMLKYHGIFLIPGLLAYILAIVPKTNAKYYLKTICLSCFAVVAAFSAARFGIGMLFAGLEAFSISGRHYNDVATQGITALDPSALIGNILYCLRGHLTGLVILFGPALAMTLVFMLANRQGEKRDPLRRIIILAVCLYIPLLLVTVTFSSLLTMWYPSLLPEIKRITWRYYSFLFPVFPIVVAGLIPRIQRNDHATTFSRVAIHGIVAAITLYILVRGFRGYLFFTTPDCPELGGLLYFLPFYTATLVCCIAAALVGIVRPHTAAKGYVYIVLPFMFLSTTILAQIQIRSSHGIEPDLYDKGGILAKDKLGDNCADLTIIDKVPTRMLKAVLQIDNPGVDTLVNPGPVLDMDKIEPGKKWLLIFNGVQVPEQYVESGFAYDILVDPPGSIAQAGRNSDQVMKRIVLLQITNQPFSINDE